MSETTSGVVDTKRARKAFIACRTWEEYLAVFEPVVDEVDRLREELESLLHKAQMKIEGLREESSELRGKLINYSSEDEKELVALREKHETLLAAAKKIQISNHPDKATYSDSDWRDFEQAIAACEENT